MIIFHDKWSQTAISHYIIGSLVVSAFSTTRSGQPGVTADSERQLSQTTNVYIGIAEYEPNGVILYNAIQYIGHTGHSATC